MMIHLERLLKDCQFKPLIYKSTAFCKDEYYLFSKCGNCLEQVHCIMTATEDTHGFQVAELFQMLASIYDIGSKHILICC